jgi:hypothetical protein
MKIRMQSSAAFFLLTLFSVGMIFGQTPPTRDRVWFHQQVTWRIGTEPRTWETTVTSPDGKQHYLLALVPWHGTEGGGWIEIRLSRPSHPQKNLLDPGKWRRSSAYFVTGEDLEHPEKSQFGICRHLRCNPVLGRRPHPAYGRWALSKPARLQSRAHARPSLCV